jgi:hypothetical protein
VPGVGRGLRLQDDSGEVYSDEEDAVVKVAWGQHWSHSVSDSEILHWRIRCPWYILVLPLPLSYISSGRCTP